MLRHCFISARLAFTSRALAQPLRDGFCASSACPRVTRQCFDRTRQLRWQCVSCCDGVTSLYSLASRSFDSPAPAERAELIRCGRCSDAVCGLVDAVCGLVFSAGAPSFRSVHLASLVPASSLLPHHLLLASIARQTGVFKASSLFPSRAFPRGFAVLPVCVRSSRSRRPCRLRSRRSPGRCGFEHQQSSRLIRVLSATSQRA